MLENRRTEQEMMHIILETAKQDKRIRAVYMNGSRANEMVPTDDFQDFDIVYTVTDLDSFLQDRSWLTKFGKLVILQEPYDRDLFPEEERNEDVYTFLMQFQDGNRIDLTLQTIKETKKTYGNDSLTIPLLDKDHILKSLPSSNDDCYHVKRPEYMQYLGCRNEFFWVCAYVAKGLYRREILYAMDHLENYVRPQLMQMLSWEAGFLTDFAVSVGKNQKYLDKYLPKDRWEELMQTYARADYEEIWDALVRMQELFEKSADTVACAAGFEWQEDLNRETFSYDRRGEAMRMKSYVNAVRALGEPEGFQLIALDLDGTLLNEKKELTKQTKQVLMNCISKGIVVVPSTGRPEAGLPDCVREIPGISYVLTSNGARIADIKTGEIIYSDFMKKDIVLHILDETQKRGLCAEIYCNGWVYVEEEGFKKQLDTIHFGIMGEYIRKTRKPVKDIKKWLEELSFGIEKINLVCQDKKLREELWHYFSSREDLVLTNSVENNIEFNHVTANKGTALLKLGMQLGIEKEQIIAFGDSRNDSAMLRAVGFGVAMGNAEPEIKAVANYVTASNEEEGVAKALMKFVLK